jgi:hypothetical protein
MTSAVNNCQPFVVKVVALACEERMWFFLNDKLDSLKGACASVNVKTLFELHDTKKQKSTRDKHNSVLVLKSEPISRIITIRLLVAVVWKC